MEGTVNSSSYKNFEEEKEILKTLNLDFKYKKNTT